MPRTCAVVGAVVSTRASPSGCTSIHQQMSTAVRKLLPTECPAATIVLWLLTMEWQISICFDHSVTPSTS